MRKQLLNSYQTGSMPWRFLACAVAGEAMNSSSACTSVGRVQPVVMAAEKVVVIWISGGSGPTMVMPGWWISSLSC